MVRPGGTAADSVNTQERTHPNPDVKTEIVAMGLLFAATVATGVVGVLLLPAPWPPVFGSLAGIAGLGLAVTGYAIRKE